MRAWLPATGRFLGLDDGRADPRRAGVVVIPVPFERTSSYGQGSAGGPAAILAASRQVELFDAELNFEPSAEAGGIVTLAPVVDDPCPDGRTLAGRLEREVAGWLEDGMTVVTLAGEHTGVVGAIRAHTRRDPDLTVLQLDAHGDFRPTYLDDPWNHACTMARVADHHRRIVQVGIRSQSTEDVARARELAIPVFRCAELRREQAQGRDWIAPIIAACAPRVYLTIDCDVFDPAVIPATGTPEPGGLGWSEMDALLGRLCQERRVIGFDLSELAPIPGLHFPQFTAAKLTHRLIGRIAAAAVDAAVRVGDTDVGRGVFVTRDFAPGETILRFRGDVIDAAGAIAKGPRECDAFQIGPDAYLDLRSPEVYVNHSCAPNVGIRDDLRLVALRALRSGEEIRYDYSTTMDEDRWTMACRCGEPGCRGVVGDFKHLPREAKRRLIGLGIVQPFIIAAELESGRLTRREVGVEGAVLPSDGINPQLAS